MLNRFAKHLPLLLISSVLLASCGGGSSGASTVATGTETTSNSNSNSDTSTNTTTATTLGDCYALTPGVKFVRTDGSKKQVVQETFEGQLAYSAVELRANDTRFGALYQTISGGYVHLLGIGQYDGSGNPSGKDVYSSQAQFSVGTPVGQTVNLSYTNTKTRTAPTNSVTTANETLQFTFVGLETLTLGGRTFTDTCKLSTPDSVAGRTQLLWVAKGFGTIRQETQDAQGAIVPGTRNELTSIVSAP
jgi:hypothetical protein